MSSYAPFFLVAAVVAGVLGFTAFPSTAATVIKGVSMLFVLLFVFSLVRIWKAS